MLVARKLSRKKKETVILKQTLWKYAQTVGPAYL